MRWPSQRRGTNSRPGGCPVPLVALSLRSWVSSFRDVAQALMERPRRAFSAEHRSLDDIDKAEEEPLLRIPDEHAHPNLPRRDDHLHRHADHGLDKVPESHSQKPGAILLVLLPPTSTSRETEWRIDVSRPVFPPPPGASPTSGTTNPRSRDAGASTPGSGLCAVRIPATPSFPATTDSPGMSGQRGGQVPAENRRDRPYRLIQSPTPKPSRAPMIKTTGVTSTVLSRRHAWPRDATGHGSG